MPEWRNSARRRGLTLIETDRGRGARGHFVGAVEPPGTRTPNGENDRTSPRTDGKAIRQPMTAGRRGRSSSSAPGAYKFEAGQTICLGVDLGSGRRRITRSVSFLRLTTGTMR